MQKYCLKIDKNPSIPSFGVDIILNTDISNILGLGRINEADWLKNIAICESCMVKSHWPARNLTSAADRCKYNPTTCAFPDNGMHLEIQVHMNQSTHFDDFKKQLSLNQAFLCICILKTVSIAKLRLENRLYIEVQNTKREKNPCHEIFDLIANRR